MARPSDAHLRALNASIKWMTNLLPREVARLSQHLWQNRRGVAAVEFALIFPVLLVLYIGGAEIAIALAINRKLQHVASTVDDLVTQSPSLTQAEITAIIGLSAALMEPYHQQDLRIRVSSVQIDATGKATVRWSVAGGGVEKKLTGAQVALPAEFTSLRDRWVVMAETYYNYLPLGGYGLKSPIEMGETAYLMPRIGSKVACGDC